MKKELSKPAKISKKRMSELSAEIKTLQTKEKAYGLTRAEEKRFCKLNSEMTGLPAKFFTKEFGDKLTKTIQDTDKLIKKIQKKNGN